MTVESIAERVASLGLPGTSTAPIEIISSLADSFLAMAKAERILGLVVAGIESGEILADEIIVERFVEAHDEVMGQTMRIEVKGVRVSVLLADAGIHHRLLKGAAIAHTVARSASERSFRDVDVLVGSHDMAKAVQVLRAAGAERMQPELRPGYDERFSKSVTMTTEEVEIDLHRVLCPGPFGVWMRPDDLFVLKDVITVGGVEIATLDRTDHLIHACYHVALGQVDPVLANLRDIALLAGLPHDVGYDIERFDETVSRWRGRAVVHRAVSLLQQRLDVELPTSLTRYIHEPVAVTELEAIEPYLTTDPLGRFAALAPPTLRALPLADRAAFALAVGLPEGARATERVPELIQRWRSKG